MRTRMLVSAAALALALTSMSLCGCGTLGWKAGPTGAGAMKPHAVAEEATGGGAGWTGVARVTVSALLVALCAFAARRGNESAYYGTAVLLGFIALAASGARMGLASLGLLVALQAICGIAYGYRGQPVVYFITTYVLFDVVAPLNLDMLVGHRLIAGIFRLFLLAGAFVAAQVGFRLEFLTGRSRAATARNILLCAAFLLLLALATSSSLFWTGTGSARGRDRSSPSHWWRSGSSHGLDSAWRCSTRRKTWFAGRAPRAKEVFAFSSPSGWRRV